MAKELIEALYFFLSCFCSFLYLVSSFPYPRSTFLYPPPNFLYLPYYTAALLPRSERVLYSAVTYTISGCINVHWLYKRKRGVSVAWERRHCCVRGASAWRGSSVIAAWEGREHGMGVVSMLREGREHGVGAASLLRGISTLSLSTHLVLSLSMHSVLSLSTQLVLSLSTHLVLSLSRFFLSWWSHSLTVDRNEENS